MSDDRNQFSDELVQRMRRFALLLTGDQDEAQDVVQQALENLLNPKVQTDNPSAYARRVVTNVYLNQRRRQALAHRVLPLLFKHEPNTDTSLDALIDRQVLWGGLRRLPANQRVAVVLRYFEDLQFDEIAKTMNCGDSTARSHVRRGLRALRVILTDEGDES